MIHEPEEEEEEEGRSSRKQGHSEQAPHQHTIHWMMGVSSVYYLPIKQCQKFHSVFGVHL